MKAEETNLKGCFVLEPKVFEDNRGYFFEAYNHRTFCEAIDKEINFVQDNQSFSTKGVLRGLHFQTGQYAQAKLVSVIQGRIQDVVVDLRKDSPTFGQHISVELSSRNKKRLFVPRGFAHGFLTLSQSAEVIYKCDNYYRKEAEGVIRYNNKELNIQWELSRDEVVLSDRDQKTEDTNIYLRRH
jgi:dTDP-4-dehydrorhamnose 3,5-epimerase|nr:dTDP-4-dehydrorhamnose 3,5-epimerase [uncultured Allomuricauda sp.]